MMDFELVSFLLLIGLIASLAIMAVAVSAAYRNGVTDGYGYAKTPLSPGYAKAGKYLRENCAHWWPELQQTSTKPEDWKWGTNREDA